MPYETKNDVAHNTFAEAIAKLGAQKPVIAPVAPLPAPVEEKIDLTGLTSEFEALSAKIGNGAGSIEAAVYSHMIDASSSDREKEARLSGAIKGLTKTLREKVKNGEIRAVVNN